MRVLIVGAGSIGRRHAANASRHAQVAILDTDAARARALAQTLNTISVETLDEALRWQPRAAVVATPHASHIGLCRQLVVAGVDVLVEKPLASSMDGVAELLADIARLGRRVYVGCNMRFHPGPATLHEHLSDVGRVHFARAHFGNYLPDMRPGADYRQLYCARPHPEGGVCLDGIHELDYLAWLLGDVKSVNGTLAKLSTLDIDAEDYASLRLRHAGGARSEIHLDYLQRQKRRGCEVVGAHGTLLWESEGKQPERCRVRMYLAGDDDWRTLYASEDVDGNAPYVAMLDRFLATVRDGGDAPELLHAGLAARELALLLAARRPNSARSTRKDLAS